MPIRISFKGPIGFATEVKTELRQKVSDVLDIGALNIQKTAKQLAPKDLGYVANSIGIDRSKQLRRAITVNAPYAAFMEFGTGKYAAQYVATLPATWQEYAQQFKSQSAEGGSFDDFLLKIIDWVHRKGLAGTYSIKTRKRTGNKGARNFEDASVAYAIALSIIRNGIHPHPFLYPAVMMHLQEIENGIAQIQLKPPQ